MKISEISSQQFLKITVIVVVAVVAAAAAGLKDMGCASSMKVVPSIEQNGKKGKKNVSTNGNRIRADRSSLADARVRREEESKNRLRRISSLQPEEVDRVRKLSSHNSSKGGSSFNPLREEDDSSEEQQRTTVITKQKKKKKKKKKKSRDDKEKQSPNGSWLIKNHSDSSVPESDNPSGDEEAHRNSTGKNTENKKKLKSVTDDQQNLVVAYNSVDSMEKKSFYDPPHYNKTIPVNEYAPSERTSHYRCDGDGKTDSPFAVEVHSDENNIDTRQSVDSVNLKTDANLFVNSIMAQALQQIENDKKLESSDNESSTSDNNKDKLLDGDNVSINSTVVNEHAKGLVGNVLNNALFIVSTDNK